MAAGRVASVALATRFPPQALLVGNAALGLGGCLLLGLTRSFPAALAGTAVVALGVCSIFPAAFCLPPRLGLDMSGVLAGGLVVVGNLGGATLPWVVAAAVGSWGSGVLPAVIACVFGVALCVVAAVFALMRASPARA